MLGMYVHTHWAYNWPYAARTWSPGDWRGYLEGLAALGYDAVMVWPQLECMPRPLTASDEAFLCRLGQAAECAHELGMRVTICCGCNVLPNEHAAEYAFEDRPYFRCERRFDPNDSAALRRMLAHRREQFSRLGRVAAISLIDSDPGGWVGSTNEEFARILAAHAEVLRETWPELEVVYWMWVGWEQYNHFWEVAGNRRPGEPPPEIEWDNADFAETLRLLRDQVPEPWSVLACNRFHERALGEVGLQEKAAFFPYGLVEGEPTFPLTNCSPSNVVERFAGWTPWRFPRGAMVNAQSHVLQLPNTYFVARRCGGAVPAGLAAFGEALVPGRGNLLAAGWEALEGADSEAMRSLASQVEAASRSACVGPLAGLMIGGAKRFLVDLAMNLRVRAGFADVRAAGEQDIDLRPSLRRLLPDLGAWQVRTGFADAYVGPMYDGFNARLARLGDDELDEILQRFDDWQDPRRRHGIVPLLLQRLAVVVG